jgi:predicted house-cleaning noncanonical NTP pyrophosphatase (MazG superfamily)
MNKLVRDKIPEIIAKSGNVPVTNILNDADYKSALLMKLQEECHELMQASSQNTNVQEEVADVLEVLSCIVKLHKIDTAELMTLADAKREEHGSFLNKIMMFVQDEK